MKKSNVTTNNVIFENNNAESYGGAVLLDESNYTSMHDKFINNNAENGASISLYHSILTVDGS